MLRRLWERHQGICHICLEPVKLFEATRDHLIPFSEGGSGARNNLALAHQLCNNRRAHDNGEKWLKAHPKAAGPFVEGLKRLRS